MKKKGEVANMKISICLDKSAYSSKPAKGEIAKISQRIAFNEVEDTIEIISHRIGNCGYSFTPATFYGGSRKSNNFKDQQLFALDFDDGVSWRQVLARAEKYGIPVAFIYETFSSTHENKFRVVFLHYCAVNETSLADYIQQALMLVFSECDSACKDRAHIYFGGKGLLYVNNDYNNLFFNFNDLTLSFTEFLKDKYDEHYKRNIKAFANKIGVLIVNGFPHVKIVEGDLADSNGNLVVSSIGETDMEYNIIRYATEMPNLYYEIYFYDSNEISTKTIKGKKSSNFNTGRRDLIRLFKWDRLEKLCKLYSEFSTGSSWLYHHELFGIATNLNKIDGGANRFLQILNSDVNMDYTTYKEKDWNFYINYFQKQDYYPMQCQNFCKYHDICEHGKNMIDTTKVKRNTILKIGEDKYVSIKEAEKSLEGNFMVAQNSDETLIHLIKAQTGLGKSTTYLKHLENSDRPYIIAVPTNKLKTEIFEKASLKGYDVIATPSLPERLSKDIKEKIDRLYSIGANKYVTNELRKLSKEEENSDISEYLDQLERTYNFNGHIITTHARLLTFSKEMLDKYNIIIDEDILRTLMRIDSVKIKDLKILLDIEEIPFGIKERVNDVINNDGYIKLPRLNYVLTEKYKREITSIESLSSNVIDFLHAMAAYKVIKNPNYLFDKQNEIQYLVKRDLPNKKFIILSATADEEIYKKYFGQERIKVYKCNEARYKGKLNQYPEHSYSRSYLKENNNLGDEIESIIGDINVITFKGFKSYFENSCELHFGNVEGHNCLEGKDMAIVGTPHLHESVYKLFGIALGINVENQELRYQQIKYGIYQFWLMTYDNLFLRRIQLWLIESELEQSVGRARILRNDCNVFLFSSFPLGQAEFIYLKDKK